jgi:RNA polymerase sigma-70 factor, ECF subfamily
MKQKERHALLSELLVRYRSELYGYIFAAVRNWEDADDLFQAVCLVLWKKFEAFQPGTNFIAWARQTARYEVVKYLSQKQLPQFVNTELLDTLTEIEADVEDEWTESYLVALRRCRQKLIDSDAKLLRLHYGYGLGSRQIAERLRRSQQSICRSLNRIRSWLYECVQSEVARQKHSGVEPS